METNGQVAPGAVTEPQKKKRTLPAALRAYQLKKGEKLQKGQKRGTTPAASPETKVTAANAGAVTVRRHTNVLSWLGL
jgi:hypothetical protein